MLKQYVKDFHMIKIWELIYFLIKEHLTMSSFSQKRDMDDIELIKESEKDKTIEKLEYLILTFCDLSVWPPMYGQTGKETCCGFCIKKHLIC